MGNPLASLHAQTPELTVFDAQRGICQTLQLLNSPEQQRPAPRLLHSLTSNAPLTRTTTLQGPRPLLDSTGSVIPEAVTTLTLAGLPLRLYTADGDNTLMLPDAAGRPLWSQNAQGTISTLQYETLQIIQPREPASGRPLAMVEQPAGSGARTRERYLYAPIDATSRARNMAGTRHVHYHNAGCTTLRSLSLRGLPLATDLRLLTPETGLPDWSIEPEHSTEPALLTSATYDTSDAPLTITNAAQVTTVTAYDVSGAVAQTRLQHADNVKHRDVEVVTLSDIQRHADGRVLSHTAGNGVVETFRYASHTQFLTRHTTRRPSDHPGGALLISDLHYTYDPVGNLLTLDDEGTDPEWHDNQLATGLRTYAYDTLYRLTVATGRERMPAGRNPKAPAAGGVWTPYSEAYRYDDGNNLTRITHKGSTNNRSRELTVATGSNRAWLKEQGMTPEEGFFPGGLQKQLENGQRLNWYADGQLQQVSAVIRALDDPDDTQTYHYTEGGTRTRKICMARLRGGTQCTVTAYAGGCEIRQRLHSNQATPQKHVVISQVDHVRLVEDCLTGESFLRYNFYDHLGSSTGEADQAGRITAREEYSAYGMTVGSDESLIEGSNLTQRTYRHAGKEQDSTGLIYYGWRYYQPALGRWLSADPGGVVDGVNLFRFCRNNPIDILDTDGRGCASSKQSMIPKDPLVKSLDHASSNFSENMQPGQEQRKHDAATLADIVESENIRQGKHRSNPPGTIKYFNDVQGFAFFLARTQQKTSASHIQAVVHMTDTPSVLGHNTVFDLYKAEGATRATLVNVESAMNLTRRGLLAAGHDDVVEDSLQSLQRAIKKMIPNASNQPRIITFDTAAQKSPQDCGIFSIANARVLSEFSEAFIQLHEKLDTSLIDQDNTDLVTRGSVADLEKISTKFFKYSHSDTLLENLKPDSQNISGQFYISRNQLKQLRTQRGELGMNVGIEKKRMIFLQHAIKHFNR